MMKKKLITNSHYKIKIKHKTLDSGLNKRQAELKKLIDQHGTALKKGQTFYYLDGRQFHCLLNQTAINKIMQENQNKTKILDKLTINKYITEEILKDGLPISQFLFASMKTFENDEIYISP